MTKTEVKERLQEEQLDEVLELIEEAEQGELGELELVESLGLLRNDTLNSEVINVLQEEGVKITYIPAEE
ncbi:putative house-cleaning noncanonical NTP pyrophosphatase (MazG superfamily) [Salibacterium salarium]|uniref:Uncharacterized protein n=1 Tax=Salibacterium salarium TaxID=284579 RepID=A0A3R9QLY0_9BACI|nr:hypothetical protein [Salibacterium salarium]MDQ0299382.1 putative house-cleaning noncanonical NTP pyrophosphatase (MazG superfamily) [Salibacterium salarium]RSL33759.1 hypothetical protein D7Z54_08690 [Salibacterium salarium]